MWMDSEKSSWWRSSVIQVMVILSAVGYRRQLDLFQFLKDVSPSSVLTNWKEVAVPSALLSI